MSAAISILFYAKKSKTTNEGLVPIYMRITIGGERYEISTKRYVCFEDWSVAANRMKGNSEDAKSMNTLLESLRAKAYNYQKLIHHEGKDLTIDSFKHKWLGVVDERPRMLLEIFEHHNIQMRDLVNQEFAPLTLERYITSKKHTHDFVEWKYHVSDINIKDLNYEFIADYEFWLKSIRKCSHNTTMKYLSNFKKIVNICLKNAWLARDPFLGYKMTKRDIERPYLSHEELEIITSKNFLSERISRVRDIFLFSCYTGLAYADVWKLNRSEIMIGIDGEKWIFTHRKKTETSTRIPVLPPAQIILDRYKDHPQCLNQDQLLPILSNQKMNSYLKEVADICGITKKMTFHMARHTFATTVTLTNGVPIETVSKMLGHKNLKTTQHYAKILDIKVSHDMKGLRDKLSEPKIVSTKLERTNL